MHMDVERDADKAVANFKKHGARFEEAITLILPRSVHFLGG